MKIVLLMTGKTDEEWLREGITVYEKRITRYARYESVVIPDVRNTKAMPPTKIMEKEAEKILSFIRTDDLVILLDEKGKTYRTVELASYLQTGMHTSKKRMVFVIGGAWGFDPMVKARADHQVSLSRLTFSHQMVRLLFTEQLYRVLSVIAGDPYHHE